ncbi:MAG: L-arabinose isomerase [Fusobacteriaceae bacterium]|jgi:L-arabinose isomerase|nr:L-arabinose isomerase [Fusobacteriaceae bacterium]
MTIKEYKFWFVAGSQFLYGEETLKQVKKNCEVIVAELNKSKKIPCGIEFKTIVVTNESATKIVKEANYDDSCAGIITFCHTFSPSKMWINALVGLQKPWLHFHTQFNEEIPNEAIDMDYMNLHQSAHGDREHGFIGARLRTPRKVVAGYWKNPAVQEKIGKWQRSAVGAALSKALKVVRFGDNMREVAVTEGDKVGVQAKLGWQVNTFPVGELVEYMEAVSEKELNAKLKEYKEKYNFDQKGDETVRYQAREEIAILKILGREGAKAFSNTFQDLYGMKQLPGLATQNIMAAGYGYGGEGDWKVSAMTAIVKGMTEDLKGGTSFMEDYTYDLKNGISLGAHMLEVCPTLAAGKVRIETHPLGIGDREPPARLVFEGKAGPAVVASLIDMGGRLRLIVQDILCVKPSQTMPNLPVARVMWKPLPDLERGAECWILAGGAHHTVLSYDVDAEILRDWARIMEIEFVYINEKTEPETFEKELLISDMVWRNQ